jgi:alpha-L-arabinofuranosidase
MAGGDMKKTFSLLIFLSLLLSGLSSGFSQEPEQVVIDANITGEVISPLLFGQNLEHTRRAIWQGISAEMIDNRKFAATDCGLPIGWTTLTGNGVSIDDRVAYAGNHSVRLENKEGNSCGIWQQHSWLAFGKDVKYAFRVWTKSDVDQTVLLQIVDRPGFHVVFSGETFVRSGDWQLWSGEFISPVPVKGGRLEIRLKTPGTVWIGAVSLMPANNFHGMRHDVVELFKQLKPGCLRWPGGCFAEYYNWKDGLLPVDKRPPIGPGQWVGLLPDSHGYDNHEIGTDEFIALCRELNCAPAITIRYGEGSPEEAASWVEYCNGGVDTYWGKVRADRGHPEPYHVKYWYVGNEIWGMSLVKNKDPEFCTALSRRFTEAMMKADPGITPIRCARFLDPDWQPWIIKEMTEYPEFPELIQDGYYGPDYAGMVQMSKAPTMIILPSLMAERHLLDNANTGKKRVGIAFYEWNTMWDRPGDVISGVFAAGMLNMFCREAEHLELELTGYFQPVTEGAIKVDPQTSELEPDGEVFALFAPHQGNRLLKTSPLAADTDIDLCASLSPDGKSIFVTVINRNTTNDRTLELSMLNFISQTNATAKFLIPLTQETGGEFVKQDENLKVSDRNELKLKIPACTIVGILFSIKIIN